MKVFAFAAVCFITLSAQGQSVPTLFEPDIISNGGVFGLTISPDSKIALWVSSNGKRDTLRIMESRKSGGKWSTPKVASFSTLTGAWKDIDPVFSPDGKTVLFQSTRNTNRNPDRKDFDLWAVDVSKNASWSQPYHLGNSINTEASESYASMSNDRTIYFMKENENKVGQSDLYFSTFKNGSYQVPVNLGLPINTNERESNPFISPKGDYILYFSTDSSGFGEVDLFISFKKDGTWSQPKNLGQPINSELAEFCPFVHEKEKRLYFTRQKKQGDRMMENVYVVDFDVNKYR